MVERSASFYAIFLIERPGLFHTKNGDIMFRYKIKTIADEEILILEVDLSMELAREFGRHPKRKKKRSWKEEILSFLEEKKISWHGKKIVVMAGGVVLATLLLVANPNSDVVKNPNYVSKDILPEMELVYVDTKEEDLIQEEVSVDEEKTDHSTSQNESNQNSQNKPVNKPGSNQTTKPNSSQNSGTSGNQSTVHPITPPTTNGNPADTEENTAKEQMVTIYRSNGQVITIPISEYLIGVVAAEMPASFSLEALKAQSVVSRTYALKLLSQGRKLTDTSSTQNYKDNNQLKAMWGNSYTTYYQKIKQAVEETKNITIQYQGQYIDAVYHSTSNGKTEDAAMVWGNDVPYLKSVDSKWDLEASSYLRTTSIELSHLFLLLGIPQEEMFSFQVLERTASGRVKTVQIGNQIFQGVDLRTRLGLRSTDFDFSISESHVIVTTKGYGHGVGMSQYGANGMAKAGYTYDAILKHYYQGVTLVRGK